MSAFCYLFVILYELCLLVKTLMINHCPNHITFLLKLEVSVACLAMPASLFEQAVQVRAQVSDLS